VGINLFHAARSLASISTSSTSSSSSPHASSSSSRVGTSSCSTTSSSPMRVSKSNAGLLAPFCDRAWFSRSSSSSSSRPMSRILRELFESTNFCSSSLSSLVRFWRLAAFCFQGSEGAYSSASGLCRCWPPGDLGALGMVGCEEAVHWVAVSQERTVIVECYWRHKTRSFYVHGMCRAWLSQFAEGGRK
jgi:hypothetical protein